ncbi:MAG: type II toxin-antitoxin system RelE/ParE family toxin [Gemmatimonas sp.]
MRFIESAVFTSSLRRHLDDEQYRALQVALSLRPAQGTVIPGGAGLRKLRWGAEGRGTRGGVRTIYYWAVADDLCYMVYLYAKNEHGDLSPKQIRTLARVVREEFR